MSWSKQLRTPRSACEVALGDILQRLNPSWYLFDFILTSGVRPFSTVQRRTPTGTSCSLLQPRLINPPPSRVSRARPRREATDILRKEDDEHARDHQITRYEAVWHRFEHVHPYNSLGDPPNGYIDAVPIRLGSSSVCGISLNTHSAAGSGGAWRRETNKHHPPGPRNGT